MSDWRNEERTLIPPNKKDFCMPCSDAIPCSIIREICNCACHKKKAMRQLFGEDLDD